LRPRLEPTLPANIGPGWQGLPGTQRRVGPLIPVTSGAYPRVEHLASPTNIRLGWKGLPGTNALAYYEKL